jgi:RNA polymerase sigma factor (sigma-70 family)
MVLYPHWKQRSEDADPAHPASGKGGAVHGSVSRTGPILLACAPALAIYLGCTGRVALEGILGGDPTMHILIVDDHPLVCSALEATLTAALECTVMQAHSASEALQTIEAGDQIDLVLLDLKLPDTEGFQALAQLRKRAPRLPLLVLSGLEDARLVQLVRGYGAMGFLNKKASAAKIIEAVTDIMAGETVFDEIEIEDREADEKIAQIARAISSLTPQQQTVLRMLGEGLFNKQIAYELSISESTVKTHVSAILTKLEVSSRMQAVLIAQGGVFDQAPGLLESSTTSLELAPR